jgi:hypothetical protein
LHRYDGTSEVQREPKVAAHTELDAFSPKPVIAALRAKFVISSIRNIEAVIQRRNQMF